jgi:hypothetical protein
MATDVVGSKMPAQNGYGQNGYAGPSSVTPGDQTCGKSGFLPACDLPKALGDYSRLPGIDASETRTVSDKQYAAKQAGATNEGKMPPADRPVTRSLPKGATKSKSLYKDFP